jgi:hypothetical protein
MEATEVITSQTEALKEALRLSKREWHRDNHIYVLPDDRGGYTIEVIKTEVIIPGVVRYRNGIKTTWPK